MKALPLALLGLMPYSQAQIILSPAQQASITHSANGVPVLEINNPNNSGLSHNRLNELNVTNPGLIFNNSLRGGNSQIGGHVMHNPNLTREARAILAEITGNNPSYLEGTLEVFGGRADIFIANPNGLTLNGVKTYNASGLVVTTGNVVLGGSGPQFRVDQNSGPALIGANGVNTEGLTYFDIVSRAIELNGEVGSQSRKTDIMGLAGLNTYDATTRVHHKHADSGDNAPAVAIGGTAAGAMHGSFITLISTESGAGVRHEGLIRSARNIHISANGDITMGNGQAGNGIIAGGLVEMKSSNNIVLNNDVKVDRFTATADSLRINGATLEALGTQLVGAAKAINIVANDFTLSGGIHITNPSNQLIPINQTVVIRDGQLQAKLPSGRFDPKIKLTTTAMLKSGGGIAITANRVHNDKGVIEDTSTRGIHITAGTMLNQGLVQSKGDLSLTAGVLNNLCFTGAAIGAGYQSICGGFLISGKGEMKIGQLTNEGGLFANNTLDLELGNGTHSSGSNSEIVGTRGLTITQAAGQKASLNNAGRIATSGDMRVVLESLTNTAYSGLSSGKNLELLIDKALITGATISAGHLLTINAENIRTTSTSVITAVKNAAINAKDTLINDNGSTMLLRSDLKMTAGGDMTTGAQIDVKGHNATIAAAGQLVNARGSILSTTNLDMSSGGTLTNDDNSIIAVHNKLVMESVGDMHNLAGSVITSNNIFELKVGGTLTNDGGALIEAEHLNIDALQAINSNGAIIASYDQLNIKTTGDIRNETGGSITSKGTAIINAGGALSNDRAVIKADKLELAGQNVSNSNLGEITAGKLQINAQGTFKSQSGATTRADKLVIDANRFDATASNVLATDDLQLKTLDFNNSATVHSKNTASITMKDGSSLVIGAGQSNPTADTLLSIFTRDLTVNGSLSNPGAVLIRATGDILNRGEILTGKWLDAKAAGAIDNQANKLIWAAGNIDLHAGTTLTNRQNGLIRATNNLTMGGGTSVINEVGRIDAGRNIAIDTALLENRSAVSGDLKIDGTVHTDNWYTEDWGLVDTEYFHTEFWTPKYSAADLLVKQGVIQAKGDLLLNQGAAKGTQASVRNLGGLMGAAGNVKIDGNIDNLGSSKSINLVDYLKSSSAYARWSVSESSYSDGPELHANLYDLLDKNLLFTDLTTLLDDLMGQRSARLSEVNAAYKAKHALIPEKSLVDGLDEYMAFINARDALNAEGDRALQAVYDEFKPEEDRLRAEIIAEGLSPAGKPVIRGSEKWMYSLRKTATPEANILFSAIFGADWKNLNHKTMRERWEAFKAAPEQNMDFYADKQAELTAGADFVHTGGLLKNGTGAQWNKNRTVDVQIGDEKLVTVGGEMDAIFNRESAFDLQGNDYLAALHDALNASSILQDLINNNPLFNANFNLANANSELDPSNPDFKGVYPLYTSRVMYDTDAYYGSEYLFTKIGYDPTKTVTVLGDAYFDNELIVRNIENSVGNFFSVNRQLSGTGLVQNLLDNAASQLNKLGLVMGQPLTQEQYEQLESDIVWYETQVVNGITVLAPKVYLSKNTLLARQYDQNNGGLIAAQNVLIDAKAVDNINGVIRGVNDTLIYSEADINNVSQGGANTGIYGGDNGRLVVAAEGKVLNQGGNLQGLQQTIVGGEGVTSTATTGFNEKGNLVVRNNGILGAGLTGAATPKTAASSASSATTDSATTEQNTSAQAATGTDAVAKRPPIEVAKPDVRTLFEAAKQQSAEGALSADAGSSVTVISGGDLNLIGAQTIADKVTLQATGNLNMQDIHKVSSDFTSSTKHGFLSYQTTRETFANASSTGNQVNAHDLNISVGGNWNITGSDVNAQTSEVNVGGDATVAAGKEVGYYEKVQKTAQIIVGGTAGAVGHEASGEASQFDTQKTPTGSRNPSMSDQDLNLHAGAQSGANKNRGDTAGARFRVGMEIVETKETMQDKVHTNSQLDLGSGSMTIGGTFDLGGADINAGSQLTAEQRASMSATELAAATAAMPSLSISAGDIKSTKFVDTHKQTFEREETFFGVTAEVHSSFLDVAGNVQKTAEKAADGMEIDPTLTAIAAAGNATQMAFGEALGASRSIGMQHTKTSSESQSTAENINQIGGNIKMTTTKGDITLNGVSIQGGNVELDSAGAINQRAAQNTRAATSETQIHNAGITESAGAAPTGVGMGISIGADGSYDKTRESSTSFTNSAISGANVTIKAKGDHNMEGATIKAGHLDYAIDGTQNITSVQDVGDMAHTRGSWSASVGVAITTNGLIQATGSASASGGKDYDRSHLTAEQSGISSNSMNMHIGGDQNLTGAHIVNSSGQGSYRVDGTVTANQLHDSRDKDGGYAGGGGGVSKNGLASVSIQAGRVDQVKYNATQNSTIDLGGLEMSVGGDVNGTLNRDATKQVEVTQDRKIAGTDIKIELSMPSKKKKKDESKTDTAKHVETSETIDIPTAKQVDTSKTIDIATAKQVDTSKTIDIATAKQVNTSKTVDGPSKTTTKVNVDAPDGAGSKAHDNNARHMTAATTGVELKNALAKLNSPNRADQASLKANPMDVTVRGPDGNLTTYKIKDAASLKALHGKQVVTGERAEGVNANNPNQNLGHSSNLYIKVIPQPGGGFTTSFTPTPPRPLK